MRKQHVLSIMPTQVWTILSKPDKRACQVPWICNGTKHAMVGVNNRTSSNWHVYLLHQSKKNTHVVIISANDCNTIIQVPQPSFLRDTWVGSCLWLILIQCHVTSYCLKKNCQNLPELQGNFLPCALPCMFWFLTFVQSNQNYAWMLPSANGLCVLSIQHDTKHLESTPNRNS